MSISYRSLKHLGDEPRGWNPDNTEFTIYKEQDDNEVPQPFQDEFEEDESDQEDYDYCEDTESDHSDCETKAPMSFVEQKVKRPRSYMIILQEEDYVPE